MCPGIPCSSRVIWVHYTRMIINSIQYNFLENDLLNCKLSMLIIMPSRARLQHLSAIQSCLAPHVLCNTQRVWLAGSCTLPWGENPSASPLCECCNCLNVLFAAWAMLACLFHSFKAYSHAAESPKCPLLSFTCNILIYSHLPDCIISPQESGSQCAFLSFPLSVTAFQVPQ